MQWHRDKEIGAGEDIRSRAVHPSPERASDMGAITVLQPEHQMSAVPVVTEHRTRAIPGPPLARTVRAQRILIHRMRKGRAAKRTPGLREKRDPRPTAAAQTIGLIDDLAASEAARRQHPVDYRPAEPEQAARSAAGETCRCLHSYTSSGWRRLRQRAIAGGLNVSPIG